MAQGVNLVGTSGNDYLGGTNGDDTIDGGAGHDILEGARWIDGQFDGNDTYIFGRGYDRDEIRSNHQTRDPYDSFGSGSIVKMNSDVRPKDIKLDIVKVMIGQEDADDAPQWNLTLTIKKTNDVLTIEDYLHVTADGRGAIEFSDGTSWTYADVIKKVSRDSDFKDYVKANGPLKSYITGHNGNDTLKGTNAGEYIEGGAGNDSISALGGKDSIFGGFGNDTIDAGSGDDYVRDIGGNNVVLGGTGDDEIITGAGNDSIAGGNGDDTIDSSIGSDTVNGGAGNDSIHTEGGAGTHSTVLGGDGNDYIYVSASEAPYTTDLGTNFLDGGDGDDVIGISDYGASTLLGGAGDDRLSAGTFYDGFISSAVLDGGAGNDILSGSHGNQIFVFDQGYGFDRIYARHDDRPNYYQYQEGLLSGDIVKFGSQVTAANITLDIVQEHEVDYFDPSYTQTWWHLDLTITGTTDTLRVEDYLNRNPANVGVITFADGTSWSYADVLSKVATDVDTIAFIDYVATLPAIPAAHSADLFLV